MNRREIANKSKTCPPTHRNPQNLLGRFAGQLLHRPRSLVSAHMGRAVTLGLTFYPHKNFRVHSLRTRVAAPQAPSHCRKQEQRQRANNQQAGKINKVLRVEHQLEDVKTPCRQIKQNRLPFAPVQPRQPVKQQLREENHVPTQPGKQAAHAARVNFLVRCIERDQLGAGTRGGRDRAGVSGYRDGDDRTRRALRRLQRTNSTINTSAKRPTYLLEKPHT